METLHYVLELARLSSYGSGPMTFEEGSPLYLAAQRCLQAGLIRGRDAERLIVIDGLSNAGFIMLTTLGAMHPDAVVAGSPAPSEAFGGGGERRGQAPIGPAPSAPAAKAWT